MLKLLKIDLYKFKHTLSTWVLFLCIIIFTITSLSITYTSQSEGTLPSAIEEISSQITIPNIENMTIIEWCIDATSGDFLMLFIAIFAILFSTSDFSSGYIKNIYGCINGKWKYIISKLIVVFLFVFSSILLTYITASCYCKIVVHAVEIGDFEDIVLYTLMKMLLLTAYGMLCVTLSIILRKATTVLVVIIGYSFMFSSTIYTIINKIINSLLDVQNFAIEKYALVSNTISVSVDMSLRSKEIGIIVGLIAILVSLLLSNISFTKQDI